MEVIQVNEKYSISLELSNPSFMTILFGATDDNSSFKFEHKNIYHRYIEMFEFKHDSKTRGKYWTQKPGKLFALIFKREDVKILPKEGHSYVSCQINGVDVTLNVSGGTRSGGGWGDIIHDFPHSLVNMKKHDLERIADVAIDGNAYSHGQEEIKQKEDDIYTLGYLLRKVVCEMYPNAILKSGKREYVVKGYHKRGFEVEREGKQFYLPFNDVDWKAFYLEYVLAVLV